MDLSIIVPSYNVENYLKRCIESLTSLKKYGITNEIIIVNDGSTDSTLQVANKLKELYKEENINIINQKNMGLSESRNNGLKIAKGEYVYFIDSDDYVIKEKFIDFIKKVISDEVDMGVGRHYMFSEGNIVNYKKKIKKKLL